MARPHESITESGFIRSLCLVGNPETLSLRADQLTKKGVDGQLWTIGSRKDRLYFHIALWEQMMPDDGLNMAVGYSEASLCPHISYHRTFKEVRVNQEKKLFIEKQPVSAEILLDHEQQMRFQSLVHHPDRQAIQSGPCSVDRFEDYEFIHPGLQDYF
jgi:hypothetical protein